MRFDTLWASFGHSTARLGGHSNVSLTQVTDLPADDRVRRVDPPIIVVELLAGLVRNTATYGKFECSLSGP